MATLKSRTLFPPGGYQMLHPEAGQKTPYVGSFTAVVNWELAFRQKNAALAAKHNWSLDPDAVANDVDAYNAQRMVAGGFLNFVDMEGQSPPPPPPGGTGRSGVGVVAAAVSGLAVYRELFSGGSVPVAHDEAERRAAICLACPLNRTGSLRDWFVESMAKSITDLYGVLRDHKLTTSLDAKLGTCTACSCPTRAKVHVSLDTINRHMKPAVRAKLHPSCWITATPAGS